MDKSESKRTSRRRFLTAGAGAAAALALHRAGGEPVLAVTPADTGGLPVGRLVLYGFGPASNPNPHSPISSVGVYNDSLWISIDVDRHTDKWSDALAAKVKSRDQFHAALEVFKYPLTSPPEVGTRFESTHYTASSFNRYDNVTESFSLGYPIT